MPGAAGPEVPRIVGEVWPLELIARESDPGAPAAVDALAPFGQASPRRARQYGSGRRPTMKLGAEPMETPRFGAIAAVSRSRSTRWSIQAHCQRSYVRVEILKNESLHPNTTVAFATPTGSLRASDWAWRSKEPTLDPRSVWPRVRRQSFFAR
jgi:hypothetical protein